MQATFYEAFFLRYIMPPTRSTFHADDKCAILKRWGITATLSESDLYVPLACYRKVTVLMPSLYSFHTFMWHVNHWTYEVRACSRDQPKLPLRYTFPIRKSGPAPIPDRANDSSFFKGPLLGEQYEWGSSNKGRDKILFLKRNELWRCTMLRKQAKSARPRHDLLVVLVPHSPTRLSSSDDILSEFTAYQERRKRKLTLKIRVFPKSKQSEESTKLLCCSHFQ